MTHLAVLARPEPVALAPERCPVADDVVVLKFGSSVLRGPAQAPAVASEIYRHVRAGRRVVAVVSAFAGQTDRLLAEARGLGLDHDNGLLPAYVAQGEEAAAAFTAIAFTATAFTATDFAATAFAEAITSAVIAVAAIATAAFTAAGRDDPQLSDIGELER